MYKKRLLGLTLACLVLLAGCGTQGSVAGNSSETDTSGSYVESESSNVETQSESGLDQIDMTQWQYNEENDVYWQLLQDMNAVHLLIPMRDSFMYMPGVGDVMSVLRQE